MYYLKGGFPLNCHLQLLNMHISSTLHEKPDQSASVFVRRSWISDRQLIHTAAKF